MLIKTSVQHSLINFSLLYLAVYASNRPTTQICQPGGVDAVVKSNEQTCSDFTAVLTFSDLVKVIVVLDDLFKHRQLFYIIYRFERPH